MSGWELDLGAGVTLRAGHVPSRVGAYLGVQKGTTFVAVARFISDADMEFLRDTLNERILILMTQPPGGEAT